MLNEHNCKVLGTTICTHTVEVIGENHDCPVSIHQPVGSTRTGSPCFTGTVHSANCS